ncbi:hypothetical protein F5Y19DRAFT_431307 [Xylariaceae sp. FL1651]|nr:hypothetical protein F5Y19DRAFT_431307 [Xylariaceae sp. FL1651]
MLLPCITTFATCSTTLSILQTTVRGTTTYRSQTSILAKHMWYSRNGTPNATSATLSNGEPDGSLSCPPTVTETYAHAAPAASWPAFWNTT